MLFWTQGSLERAAHLMTTLLPWTRTLPEPNRVAEDGFGVSPSALEVGLDFVWIQPLRFAPKPTAAEPALGQAEQEQQARNRLRTSAPLPAEWWTDVDQPSGKWLTTAVANDKFSQEMANQLDTPDPTEQQQQQQPPPANPMFQGWGGSAQPQPQQQQLKQPESQLSFAASEAKAPKRSMSAYMLFCIDKRSQIFMVRACWLLLYNTLRAMCSLCSL
jgi:hypothetical protein